MGIKDIPRAVSLASWKTPAGFMFAAALAVPLWQAHLTAPDTGALESGPSLQELAMADTLIVYAAPANADPVLRISSRDTEGNWQESELQLSNEHPTQSAKLVAAVVARETQQQKN